MEVSEKYKLINKELEIENKVLMENLQKQLKDYEELKKQLNKLEVLEQENAFIKKENEKLQIEMDRIKYSRTYKIASKISKIIKRR